MTRITKKIAEECATQVLTKMTQKLQRLEKMFYEYAYSEILNQIPDLVKQAFADMEAKRFIQKSCNVYLRGEGIGHWECYIKLGFPVPYAEPIMLTPAQAKEVREWMNKIASLKNQISDKRMEIEVTLLGLVTYAKVEKEFPEVYQYLPKISTPTLPAKNLDPLRDFIKNL